MYKYKKEVLFNPISEFFVALILILSVFLFSGITGRFFPKELPSIDSAALNMLLPKESHVALKEISKKNGLAEMLMVYSLAAIDSSQERVFAPEKDISLFFSIADALPSYGRVKMFRFKSDNILEIDYIGNEDGAKLFCNKLGLTGKFSTVYYEPVNNTNTYTIYGMIMGD